MTEEIRNSIVDKKNFHVSFWKTDDYKTSAEALENGAMYVMPCIFYGYESYKIAMTAAFEAVNCIDTSALDSLMVRLVVNQEEIGSFEIEYCY